MRCELCLGTGKAFVSARPLRDGVSLAEWLAYMNKPCRDCGGSGIAHCCEGDQAQPEPPERERQP